MDGYGQLQTTKRLNPMQLLSDAFGQRRILRYIEGNNLIVNDPYLRQKVEISWSGRGYRWTSPGGDLCSGDPGHVADVVHQIIRQYAGIYLEDR
ncbi:hypothetical protein [Nocardiopsis exhalans]